MSACQDHLWQTEIAVPRFISCFKGIQSQNTFCWRLCILSFLFTALPAKASSLISLTRRSLFCMQTAWHNLSTRHRVTSISLHQGKKVSFPARGDLLLRKGEELAKATHSSKLVSGTSLLSWSHIRRNSAQLAPNSSFFTHKPMQPPESELGSSDEPQLTI